MRLGQSDRQEYQGIWALIELREGAVIQASLEILGEARRLARDREVTALVLGPADDRQAARLIECGADTVRILDDARLRFFNDELACSAAVRLIRKHRPEIVLGAATIQGRALIPRVAVLLEAGLTADCTGLAIDPETGELLQTRPAFGGNIMATIRCPEHRPQMATVRHGVMKALEPDVTRTGTVIREPLEAKDALGIKEVLEILPGESSGVNLSDAQVIVSGGRAMKGPKGFDMLRELARELGGAVAASRPCVDSGWISYPHQVGQTGQTVQTRLYIACGISGQIQHLVGMQSCRTIIAVDINPDTPMMRMADIAVTGDVFEIVPALTAALRQRETAK